MVRGLRHNFEFEGYQVCVARDGEAAIDETFHSNPDIILLDVMLPKLSGLDVCRHLRAKGVTTPIIMLTARGQETDKVVGLEVGADDYVTKPFSIKELLARVRAHLRRAGMGASAPEMRLTGASRVWRVTIPRVVLSLSTTPGSTCPTSDRTASRFMTLIWDAECGHYPLAAVPSRWP